MSNSAYDTYTSPLASRNASAKMLTLWSARHKFNTWRRIWLAVAEAQHEVGLPVTKAQVEALRAVVNRPGGITDAEIGAAEKYERDLRHDVMAHVHALGDSCPEAKGIIHLGMTSQDVVCNADVLHLRAAKQLIDRKTQRVMLSLGARAYDWKAIPALGYTHMQPAQPVTVGRRCAMWATELDVIHRMMYEGSDSGWDRALALKGLRGATGTQASYLALFNGDSQKVEELEARVQIKFGDCRNGLTVENVDWSNSDLAFDLTWANHRVVGQTYPRIVDAILLSNLASTAAVLHKIATDIRLLCNRKELDEPFETNQIGSSAMPYKRNPMRCERICGLTRFVMNLVGNAYDTAATQWLERTLDDSSNRRLSLPEAFLALDGALDLMHNVASGLIVHEAMVRKNLMAELPFMATENILMACVQRGGDRQHYHELIRVHAQAAGTRVKDEGLDNDLLERLRADQNFAAKSEGGALTSALEWKNLLDPMKYIGRSIEQTERFIKDVIEPMRAQFAKELAEVDDTSPRV
ncbi:adenylosuccinate lyase [soil metagenome]